MKGVEGHLQEHIICIGPICSQELQYDKTRMNSENKRHHLSTSTIHRNELAPTEFSQSDTMHEKHDKKKYPNAVTYQQI